MAADSVKGLILSATFTIIGQVSWLLATNAAHRPSHPIRDSDQLSQYERVIGSPVTVARLRRIYTGFPILPVAVSLNGSNLDDSGHPMTTDYVLLVRVYTLERGGVKSS